MCVLSIKVPIRKKSGNLFNEPRICMYVTVSICSTALWTNSWNLLQVIKEKHPHIIMEPPPNLTVEMVLCFLKAVPFFRQALVAVFLPNRFNFRFIRPDYLFPKLHDLSFHKFRQTSIGLWPGLVFSKGTFLGDLDMKACTI